MTRSKEREWRRALAATMAVATLMSAWGCSNRKVVEEEAWEIVQSRVAPCRTYCESRLDPECPYLTPSKKLPAAIVGGVVPVFSADAAAVGLIGSLNGPIGRGDNNGDRERDYAYGAPTWDAPETQKSYRRMETRLEAPEE
jgi:hypothetical protein